MRVRPSARRTAGHKPKLELATYIDRMGTPRFGAANTIACGPIQNRTRDCDASCREGERWVLIGDEQERVADHPVMPAADPDEVVE